jgi:hypothetical protein
MAFQGFKRLISKTSTKFLGTDREQVAINAANNIGGASTKSVDRISVWPSLKKIDNDTAEAGSPTPFRGVQDPMYIKDQPPTYRQTAAFAIALSQFLSGTSSQRSFSIFLVSFSDNAMKAKIELFEKISDGTFVKVSP